MSSAITARGTDTRPETGTAAPIGTGTDTGTVAGAGGGRGISPLLDVRDMTLRFGGVTAINHVSFSVQPGELFAIIGPNGAGKTSIFNTISQVYKPQIGDIRWKGQSIMGMRPDRVAKLGIARTFQNIELFPGMTVIDNLLTGRHIQMNHSLLAGATWGASAKDEELANRRKVEDIIDFLEIERWRKYPVALLPYGFQKRVELGRALAMEPELLLLDEPVAGMNLEETEDMARFILDIQSELGITMILVEHDMSLVMDIADRVMVLDFGQRIALGTPDHVQRDPAVITAYLGGGTQDVIRDVTEAAASMPAHDDGDHAVVAEGRVHVAAGEQREAGPGRLDDDGGVSLGHGRPAVEEAPLEVRDHPKASMVLGLGLASLLLWVLGPVAWVMGNAARKDINASPGVVWTNSRKVYIGRACGVIATICLAVLALIVLGPPITEWFRDGEAVPPE